MGQAWRRWRDKYGKGWEKKFRQRFETEMMTKYDTHFFVGTVFNHPGTWIIVGLFLSASRERATLAGVLRLPLPIVAAVRRHPTCWAPGAPSRSLRNVASLGCHPSRRHLTVSSILRKPRSICEPSPISIRIRSISP